MDGGWGFNIPKISFGINKNNTVKTPAVVQNQMVNNTSNQNNNPKNDQNDQNDQKVEVENTVKSIENAIFKPKYLVNDKTICVGKENNTRRIRNPDLTCKLFDRGRGESELGYSCSFPTLFTTPSCFIFETSPSEKIIPSNSTKISGLFSRQPDDKLSKSLQSFWKITRKYNSTENPGVMKLWLMEFEDLVRDFHDKNYNYTRHPNYNINDANGVLLSTKRRTISKTPFPNTLFNFFTNGYPSGINADFNNIINKQNELKTFIKNVEQFETTLGGVSIFSEIPKIKIPEMIVKYNLIESNTYTMINYNELNPVTKLINNINIQLLKTKQAEINTAFININKINTIFCAKIKNDLYIYYSFCILYNNGVSDQYDKTIRKIDELIKYIVSFTSISANVTMKLLEDENEFNKNPNFKNIQIDIYKLPEIVVPKHIDIEKEVKEINENYTQIMTEFLKIYKEKVNGFVNDLKKIEEENIKPITEIVQKMKENLGKLDYNIVNGNDTTRKKLWEEWKSTKDEETYKTECIKLSRTLPLIDANYQKLLTNYSKITKELPMCRSNLLQTTSEILSPIGTITKFGKKILYGTGFILLSPILVPVLVGGSLFVVFTIGKYATCMASGCGGSKKKSKKNNKKRNMHRNNRKRFTKRIQK